MIDLFADGWSWSTIRRLGLDRVRLVIAALDDVAPDAESKAIAQAGLIALANAEARGTATGSEIIAIRVAIADADARDIGDEQGLLLG